MAKTNQVRVKIDPETNQIAMRIFELLGEHPDLRKEIEEFLCERCEEDDPVTAPLVSKVLGRVGFIYMMSLAEGRASLANGSSN